MLRYTGNPFVDAGITVLELRVGKAVQEFTAEDLDREASALEQEYAKKSWRGYLTVHFTSNSGWTNPTIGPDKRVAYIDLVLRGYRRSIDTGHSCAFCARPAQAIVNRVHVPLLTGETIMVAGAEGVPGLAVCGYCLFAIQFYPLAALKVDGRPLFWAVPDPEWNRRLSLHFYNDVRRVLSGSPEQFATLPWPSTRLLNAARHVVDEIESQKVSGRPSIVDVVGIHATNYGSGPDFEEIRIPRGLLDFWMEAGNFPLYRAIEFEQWRETKLKPGEQPSSIADLARRNELFEALGKAFRGQAPFLEAKAIASRFFLRRRGKLVAEGTTRLAELFLEKVARMEKVRLESIRQIADTIADELVIANNDRRVVWQLFGRRLRLSEFLQRLVQIQRRLSQIGKPLIWDRVLLALGLSDDEDRTAPDHWLVQELILIRLFERLSNSPVLSELPEIPDEESVPMPAVVEEGE
jgi:CRISPR-associated protein Cst1